MRVDVAYRPLRIGWAIGDGDFEAFRSAVRMSYALWGGRFNPIIIADGPDEAGDLVEAFRVDFVVPLGESGIAAAFAKRFPYLISPFFSEAIFSGDAEHGGRSHALDVYNEFVHLRGKPAWEWVTKEQVRLYTWEPDDPLADFFLVDLGDYPNVDEVHIPYRRLLEEAADAKTASINSKEKLPSDLLQHPSIPFISRYGLQRHHSTWAGWDQPGFFSGDAGNLRDLVMYWNLRAADIPVFFVDPNHIERYGETIDDWATRLGQRLSNRRIEYERQLALWVRMDGGGTTPESIEAIRRPLGDRVRMICRVSEGSWSGSVRPPIMYFDQVSTLGVVGEEWGKLKVSFALDQKPYCGDPWFHTQMLVASLPFIAGPYGDEQRTFQPPFIPELNEFYARAMHFEYNKLRSEPSGVGLVVDAADASSFLHALQADDFVERVMDFVGFTAKLSPAGLIARQLIAQLGGVDGARAFKIPGVRRLLKTHGPQDPFTKKAALELIGGRDPENPDARFSDHEGLYIERRCRGASLTPGDVFGYMVEKGLFRIGAELECSNCKMRSWISLNDLRQRVVCELCGREFDTARQLVDGSWHYRRSGVLGAERNAQGAVPVVLTLQQFKVNLGSLDSHLYSPSLDLKAKTGGGLPECEIDFAWFVHRSYPDKTAVIIGECKDRGRQWAGNRGNGTIDAEDVENLRRVADAFPARRFDAFVALVKLCPFTAEEIALARTLNTRHRLRAIMLTARELEPLHFFDRTRLEFTGFNPYGGRPEDLAAATAEMYFRNTQSGPSNQGAPEGTV
jgi:hypothetical protein